MPKITVMAHWADPENLDELDDINLAVKRLADKAGVPYSKVELGRFPDDEDYASAEFSFEAGEEA